MTRPSSSCPARAATALALVLLGLAAPHAVAAEPAVFLRHDRALAQAEELARAYPATVAMLADGGGTLIAPRWVLTAAHVAEIASPLTHTVRIGDERRLVDRIVIHPRGHSPEPGMAPEVDLALMRLAQPITSVEPVPLHRAAPRAGQDVVLVGFGDHALAGGAPRPADGTARGATNRIEVVDAHLIVLSLDRDATELEGVGAPGDSGGPLYVRGERGPELLGVSSGGDGPEGQYGMLDVYVSVPALAGWIDDTLAAFARGDERAASWRVADAPGGSPQGRVVAGLVELMRAGDVDALTHFAGEHRSEASRIRESDAAWAQAFAELASILRDRPARYAEQPRRAVFVLHRDRALLSVWFRFTDEGRIDEVVVGSPAPPWPPAPVTTDDEADDHDARPKVTEDDGR